MRRSSMSACRRLLSSTAKPDTLRDISINLPGVEARTEAVVDTSVDPDAVHTAAGAGAAAVPADSRHRVVFALIFFVVPLIASDQAVARCSGHCQSHVSAGLHGRKQAPHLLGRRQLGNAFNGSRAAANAS